jgi:menaquinone-dependent protoporphyrinogen oxidase
MTEVVRIGGGLGLLVFGGSTSFSSHFSTIQASPIVDEKNQTHTSNKAKILIAYESQLGSSAEIARFIGTHFPSDKQVDVHKINEVSDLSKYEQIIIGSAIQYDKWMKEARDFVVANENELATKTVSYFLVCLVLSKKGPEPIKKANGYTMQIRKLAPKIEVRHFGQFAGVLNYGKMSVLQRVFARGIFAILGVKEGDYRNWDQIREWTKGLSK